MPRKTPSATLPEGDLLRTVRMTLAACGARVAQRRMVVAVSGGADSTALAAVLLHEGADVILAHFHHGIRGKDADADRRFVRGLARKWKVPFFTARADVPAVAAQTGESLEMAARRLRRAFLLDTARQAGTDWIATGHTADDQAETVLLRIVRGTSVTGLAGIARKTQAEGVTWLRPLRDATHAQLVAWLRAHGQRWREDATNAESFALRNRVRNEILPLLEQRLNPGVRRALLRLSDIASAEDEVMAELARKTPRGARVPLALRRRQAVAELRAAGEEETFHRVEKSFPHCGKKFSTLWKMAEGPFSARRRRGFTKGAGTVCLSAAAVARGGGKVEVRGWKAGDRIRPLGMEGSRKLSDVFTDLKVPREERAGCAVMVCGGEIAALPGWRVARGFEVEGAEAPAVWFSRGRKKGTRVAETSRMRG